jgi:LysM domain-containing protein
VFIIVQRFDVNGVNDAPRARIAQGAGSYCRPRKEKVMSAIAAWEGHPSLGAPVVDVRRHLVLVPPVPQSELPVHETDRQGASHLRITTRGRLALTLTVIAIASFAVMLRFGPTSTVSTTVPQTATVTVMRGDTLSGLASRYLPGRPAADGVRELQHLNRMGTTLLVAGQTLVVPAAR